MAQNLATKYDKKVAERFKVKKLTEQMGKAEHDFVGAESVVVYSVATSPMNDYERTGSARYGTAAELGTTVQTLKMTKDRSFTYTIDKGNKNQSQMVTEAGKSLARQIDEVTVPEIDIYNIKKIANRAVLGLNVKEATSLKTTAYSDFLAVNELLDEAKAPIEGRIAYCKPAFVNLLKQDSTCILDSEKGQEIKINGKIAMIDNVAIVKIPSIYFPTGVNMVMVHPSAIDTPVILRDYKIHDNPPGVNGWLVEGRVMYDAFLLDAKAKGAAVLVDTVPALATSSTVGTTANGTFLKYTLPVGTEAADFEAVEYKVASSAITVPDVGSAWSGGTTYAATEIAASANTHYCLALLDADDKVLFANSGALVKGQ